MKDLTKTEVLSHQHLGGRRGKFPAAKVWVYLSRLKALGVPIGGKFGTG